MKKTKKSADEELRIYVIVPETVQVLGPQKIHRSITMEPGRLMAQVAHVTRKMENDLTCQAVEDRSRDRSPHDVAPYETVTTIVLRVYNSAELTSVLRKLRERNRNIRDNSCGGEEIGPYTFRDYNPEFYGTEKRVMTAVCTSPIELWKIATAVDHLELYGAQPELDEQSELDEWMR